jgi:RNA polymerase sigma-70 factor (ECF subfamily)
MLPHNPADIISRLKQGDTQALDELHDLFYPPLCHFAVSLLADAPAAEDIVTEIFVTMWGKHQDFATLQNIKAFLYISTRNACLNHLKRLQRESDMRFSLSTVLSLEREDFALNEMIRAEFLQQIYEAIEALPTQCRKIFKLCYIEGMSNLEVAERLSISVNTVKNHKVKALGLLRLKFLNRSSDM